MSVPLYSYSPRIGEAIAVHLADGAGESCTVLATSECTGIRVSIPDADVPEVARGILAALYEAAGLDVPILLDRPDLTGDVSLVRDFTVEATEDGEVRIGLDAARRAMPPDAARGLAAVIAARAGEAERAPDPAAVEALAEVILADERTFGGRPDKWAERAARAVLDRYSLTEREAGG